MKIFVKVKTKSKRELVEKVNDDHYVVAVKEPPVNGRANGAVITALADYFKVANWRVEIVSGQTSNQKTVEIL